MPSSSARRRDRPRQERGRSSSWSHSYRRKSQVSSSHDDDSAYVSGSASDNSSAGESESEASVEHDSRRRDHTRSHRSSHRDDERRSRKNRHNKEGPRSRTKNTLDRESDDDDEDDAVTTIARLKEQLAEAKTTNAKLENKAKKQDKAIKFLFKDNEQLKRKLEESSSRSQGKALRDLCDRNDRLDAENRQLRERFAALADLANGGSEHVSNNSAPAIQRVASCRRNSNPVEPVAFHRRNSNPVEPVAFHRRNSNPTESQQPPIAALPRPASSRRRHSMYGSVREIPTGMLQAPPPEYDPGQHKERDFADVMATVTEEDDPILGKTFSVGAGPSPSTTVPKKRIMRRRATMFT